MNLSSSRKGPVRIILSGLEWRPSVPPPAGAVSIRRRAGEKRRLLETECRLRNPGVCPFAQRVPRFIVPGPGSPGRTRRGWLGAAHGPGWRGRGEIQHKICPPGFWRRAIGDHKLPRIAAPKGSNIPSRNTPATNFIASILAVDVLRPVMPLKVPLGTFDEVAACFNCGLSLREEAWLVRQFPPMWMCRLHQSSSDRS